MKKNIVLMLSLLVFLSGCSALGGGQVSTTATSESKLNVFDGVGVLSFLPIQELVLPDGQSYLELTIRNNAEGQTAKNIVVTLDNIEPFNLLDCVGNPIPFEDFGKKHSEYTTKYKEQIVTCDKVYARCESNDDDCGFFLYDADEIVNVTQHGLKELFTGDEYDFIWGFKAPAVGTIKGIYYKQDLYYVVEFDYGTNGYYNLVAMSNTEAQRRRDSGETLTISTAQDTSAGPIRLVFDSQQVFFDVVGGQIVQNFIFGIENRGSGVLSENKKATLIARVPSELVVQTNCKDWWDYSVATETACQKVGGALNEAGYCTACSASNVLVKELDSSDLVGRRDVYIPFRINDNVMQVLRDNNIPLSTYTFFAEVNYTYAIDGSTTLQVRPIGGE